MSEPVPFDFCCCEDDECSLPFYDGFEDSDVWPGQRLRYWNKLPGGVDLYLGDHMTPVAYPVENDGYYLDLIGSLTRYSGGIISKCTWSLDPGNYTLRFRLRGSIREGARTSTRVRCGPVDTTIELDSPAPWDTYEFTFGIVDPTPVQIRFDCQVINQNFVNFDRGALLDDVELVQAGI